MFFIASIFVTWQLHVHIIKQYFFICKKVTVSAKTIGLGTKLHVEFKNNSWNNTSQPHWVLHPTSCKLIRLSSIKLNFDN